MVGGALRTARKNVLRLCQRRRANRAITRLTVHSSEKLNASTTLHCGVDEVNMAKKYWITLSTLRRYSREVPMQRLLILSFVGIVLLAVPCAFAQSFSDKAKKDSAIDMGDEEPEMQKAMDRARVGLDDFLRKAGSPPPDTDLYSVKVRVSEAENREYLWISNLKAQGDLWSGRVDNLPMIQSIKKGQLYSFAKSEIVDWTYVDKSKKKVVGNFTTCALLTKEPSDVAGRIRKEYGLDCDR
jgi:uncharacterized protein YegJ (DUF2314 family)